LQVCANDMKLPIQYALLWPQRQAGPVAPYDWDQLRTWSFEAPDFTRFPCLALAYEALRLGGTAPAHLNAANEEAVAAFLAGRVAFGAISDCNAAVLAALPSEPVASLPQVLEADHRARERARGWLDRHAD
jgi:1-deoxy-D-xylulose-5-phosphate reductoisomerase